LEARHQIFQIHLKKRKRNPDHFDVAALAQASEDFSGAEIEQAISASLFDAFATRQELKTEHVLNALKSSPPLSVTMAERVTALRAWAADRCVLAIETQARSNHHLQGEPGRPGPVRTTRQALLFGGTLWNIRRRDRPGRIDLATRFGPFDVDRHFLFERVYTGEFYLLADPVDQFDAEGLAVQVAGVADEMGFGLQAVVAEGGQPPMLTAAGYVMPAILQRPTYTPSAGRSCSPQSRLAVGMPMVGHA